MNTEASGGDSGKCGAVHFGGPPIRFPGRGLFPRPQDDSRARRHFAGRAQTRWSTAAWPGGCALGRQDFASYLDQLERQPDAPEWEDFINALTTNLTAFFRESHHFPILADFARSRGGPVSIWCCAASTGEEPYSIAITLAEALGPRASSSTVLATDIDTNVLNRARAAVYPAERVAKMEESRLKRFS